MKIKVPNYAKEAARDALKLRRKLPESKKAGLTGKEARKLGISSGVERAKQLSRSKFISEKDAKAIGRFYDRFKNKRTPKAEQALDLWGGRRFGRKLASKF